MQRLEARAQAPKRGGDLIFVRPHRTATASGVLRVLPCGAKTGLRSNLQLIRLGRLWCSVLALARAAVVGRGAFALSLLSLLLTGCATPTAAVEVSAERRRGTEIAVCGRLFDCDTPVVLWFDPSGYDAYRQQPFFPGVWIPY